MQKGLLLCCIAACLLMSPVLGHAQPTPPARDHAVHPAGPVAKPGSGMPTTSPPNARPQASEDSRTQAAEARYHAWVKKEHAQDDEAFAHDKTKIENKYKGYVRPKHPKKAAGTPHPVPPKGK